MIVVIGELNVDLIVSGTDVMPEWNREKLVDSFALALGSSSAITACALAGLGCEVQMVSVVGADQFGDYCLEQLRSKGVQTDYITRNPNLQTGVTLSLSTPKDRGLLTYMGSINAVAPEHLPAELLAQARHVHFGSFYLQDGMREHWSGVFQAVRQHGATTSFDTGWDVRNQWHREQIHALIADTDLFIPSEDELLHIYNVDSLEQVWGLLPDNRLGVAVKRGARGAVWSSGPSKELLAVNAFDIVPIDTTGAGDSFNAGIIYGYMAGMRDAELLQFANACGALATLAIGGVGRVSSVQDVELFRSTHALR
ncbi:carbohydrate kinase family protein [Paenibacillus aestuarii]|uniref:Sugar kinase n=1 Tax=Paenibacillus aestuarii TaxID=516965 RepID=A0ABW0KB89_9BACL|nr:sugar kinase [Paenibacillus aestuarii]